LQEVNRFLEELRKTFPVFFANRECAMPSFVYYRNQARRCLLLSQATSDGRARLWLTDMASYYAGLAHAADVKRYARTEGLVSRFRSSHHSAARPFANFGIEGH
jgi:hypothetical protein